MRKLFSASFPSAIFLLTQRLTAHLRSVGAASGRLWRSLPPSRRRRLRWLLLPWALGALAGVPPAALALLPLALPLSLAGAVLLPPSGHYPLSAGLGAWAQTLAPGGDGHLPLLLWFRYPDAAGDLEGLSALSAPWRTLRLLRGLGRALAAALASAAEAPEPLDVAAVTLLSALAETLATLLPLTLATLAPELSSAGPGLRPRAAEALALLLQGYALQGEMANGLLFALLPWLGTTLLALAVSLPQLYHTLPPALRAWRLWRIAPERATLLPAFEHWCRSHPFPGAGAGDQATWAADYFIPYFAHLQRWLTGPLARELNGYLAFGDSPGPLGTLEAWVESSALASGLAERFLALATALCGEHPQLSPLLGLWLALALWPPLRWLVVTLVHYPERRRQP